jgi:hypothetical protein
MRNLARNGSEFCRRNTCFIFRRDLWHAVNLTTWDRRLWFASEGSRATDFHLWWKFHRGSPYSYIILRVNNRPLVVAVQKQCRPTDMNNSNLWKNFPFCKINFLGVTTTTLILIPRSPYLQIIPDLHQLFFICGLRPRLWTAATNGHIIHPPDDEFEEPQWNDIDRGKQKNSENNLSQCHFIHLKSWIDSGANPMKGRRLTAWAMILPHQLLGSFKDTF